MRLVMRNAPPANASRSLPALPLWGTVRIGPIGTVEAPWYLDTSDGRRYIIERHSDDPVVRAACAVAKRYEGHTVIVSGQWVRLREWPYPATEEQPVIWPDLIVHAVALGSPPANLIRLPGGADAPTPEPTVIDPGDGTWLQGDPHDYHEMGPPGGDSTLKGPFVPAQPLSEMLRAAKGKLDKLKADRSLFDDFADYYSYVNPFEQADTEYKRLSAMADTPESRKKALDLLLSLGVYYSDWPASYRPDSGDLIAWGAPSLSGELATQAKETAQSLSDSALTVVKVGGGLLAALVAIEILRGLSDGKKGA